MFLSPAGLVFIATTPGESLNLFYKKSELILDKIETTLIKNKLTTFYSTSSQIEQLYNKASKEAAENHLGCKYY